MSLLAGIGAASAAAVLLNTSYLVQHAALSSAPVIRISRPLATVRALLASRRWVTGALLGYCGLALNTLALGLAPLSLVQSIVATGLVVVALGAAWARRRRPGARELVAIGLVVVALAALGTGAGTQPAVAPHAATVLAFEAIAALVAWAIARTGHGQHGRPHRLGLAAGILYGATNVALAGLLASGGAAALVTVAVVTGAAVTAGGFFAFQRGLQSGPATAVVTLMTVGTNVVAILGGLLVMREPLGATPALAALHAGAFALVVLAGLLAATELGLDPPNLAASRRREPSPARIGLTPSGRRTDVRPIHAESTPDAEPSTTSGESRPSRLERPAAAPGTPTPAALPRTCSVAPDPVG
jgi:drug/metabolite transporter (DMT)-like permease